MAGCWGDLLHRHIGYEASPPRDGSVFENSVGFPVAARLSGQEHRRRSRAPSLHLSCFQSKPPSPSPSHEGMASDRSCARVFLRAPGPAYQLGLRRDQCNTPEQESGQRAER